MSNSDDDDIFDNSNEDQGELSKQFESASNFVRGAVNKLDQEKLLYLYARYKQATEGTCNTVKPGFFDFQGKKKWDAWNGLGDLDGEIAMKEYIECLRDAEVGWKAEDPPSAGKSWNRVSRPCQEHAADEISSSSLIDLVKTSDHDVISDRIAQAPDEINSCDSEGMTPLHWACDRGVLNIVKLLLHHGANANHQASDGQTPLHFAASCEHSSVVVQLLGAGADHSLKDNEGITPSLASDSEHIRSLFP